MDSTWANGGLRGRGACDYMLIMVWLVRFCDNTQCVRGPVCTVGSVRMMFLFFSFSSFSLRLYAFLRGSFF